MVLVDVRGSLAGGGLVEITTTGRRSGVPRRIPIVAHELDGRIYLSGRPGRRDWYANVLARPALTLHLKDESLAVDLPARAVPVTEPTRRREVLERIARAWRVAAEPMIAASPLVELDLDELPVPGTGPAVLN